MILLAYDSETTGLPLYDQPSSDPRQPHIVQIAALLVDTDTWAVEERLELLVKPDGWVIPADATAIHGITQEHACANGVSEAFAVAEFIKLWRRAQERMGFNESFDARMVRIALMRFPEIGLHPDIWQAGIARCSMRMAQGVMGGRQPKLAVAYRHFTGKELQGAHSAMADTEGCLDVYRAVVALAPPPSASGLSAPPSPDSEIRMESTDPVPQPAPGTDVSTLPIPQRVAILMKSAETEKELRELVEANKDITVVTNQDGREQVHRAYMVLKNRRVLLEKFGENVRAEAVKFSRAANQEEKRLVALIDPEETRLKALRDAWDEAREEERQVEIRKELARVEAIDKEVEEIRGLPLTAVGKDAAFILGLIDQLQTAPIDEAVFMERAEAANEVRTAVLERLRGMYTERVQFEEQQARLAEQQRQHEAQVQKDRELAEQRQREQEERERVEREHRETEETLQRREREIEQQRRTRINAILQLSLMAAVGVPGVRKGGTLECAEYFLQEAQNWPVTLESFGVLIGEAHAAKDLAIHQIGTLVELRREEAGAAERRRQEEQRIAQEQAQLREQQQAQAAEQRRQDEERKRLAEDQAYARIRETVNEIATRGVQAESIEATTAELNTLRGMKPDNVVFGERLGDVIDLISEKADMVTAHLQFLQDQIEPARPDPEPALPVSFSPQYPGDSQFLAGIAEHFAISEDIAQDWLNQYGV